MLVVGEYEGAFRVEEFAVCVVFIWDGFFHADFEVFVQDVDEVVLIVKYSVAHAVKGFLFGCGGVKVNFLGCVFFCDFLSCVVKVGAVVLAYVPGFFPDHSWSVRWLVGVGVHVDDGGS